MGSTDFTHGLHVDKWLPIGSFCNTHGMLLVTHGLLQLQKQLMGDQFQ